MTASFGPPGPAVIRELKNATELAAWARNEGFRHLRPSFWHVTVILTDISSPTPELDSHELHIKTGHDRQVRHMGGLIALSFQSSALMGRHNVLREAGGRWDYSIYRPHVSFTPNDGRNLDVRPFDVLIGRASFRGRVCQYVLIS